jgi:hypothetical protein
MRGPSIAGVDGFVPPKSRRQRIFPDCASTAKTSPS